MMLVVHAALVERAEMRTSKITEMEPGTVAMIVVVSRERPPAAAGAGAATMARAALELIAVYFICEMVTAEAEMFMKRA